MAAQSKPGWAMKNSHSQLVSKQNNIAKTRNAVKLREENWVKSREKSAKQTGKGEEKRN
jgi:hypothetical protein